MRTLQMQGSVHSGALRHVYGPVLLLTNPNLLFRNVYNREWCSVSRAVRVIYKYEIADRPEPDGKPRG
jgi:hypothetical protein